MPDLTIIFLTSNKVPKQWAEYHKKVLLDAIGDYPLIIISREPTEWWTMNIIDTDKPSSENFYRQLLKGCKAATTPYIAIAEDDTLYNKEHFNCFRPDMNVFGYNMNRWSVATWGEPIYSRRESKVGAATICPRQEMIDALEEKFAKYPNGLPKMKVWEPGTWGEFSLGVKERHSIGFYTSDSIIQFNHDYFTNADSSTPEAVRLRHRKNFGKVRAYDIPMWWKAKDLINKFK